MVKHHRGRASLKERTLKNSRASKRMTRKESGAGLRRAESPDGKENRLATGSSLSRRGRRRRKGVEGTEPLGLTKRRRNSVDVEGHRGVDSGAAEKLMPRSMFPEIGIIQTERSKNGKGFKGPGGEHIKNNGQQIMSVRTSEGFVRKSTWQVADVRRPLVSASHTIHAENDLFIGKDEAYIMNREWKEKSMLRK